MYRGTLRFPRALLLVPLAAVVSYALNVVRILALIEIGMRWLPGAAPRWQADARYASTRAK